MGAVELKVNNCGGGPVAERRGEVNKVGGGDNGIMA